LIPGKQNQQETEAIVVLGAICEVAPPYAKPAPLNEVPGVARELNVFTVYLFQIKEIYLMNIVVLLSL
jgi:hypothetical protein